MKESFLRRTMIVLVSAVLVLFCSAGYAEENIDSSDDGSQYAYGENIGWLNFEPIKGPGVTVTDTDVTGFVWAENIGWVNLSPIDHGGVTNDLSGNLGGYAWGENVGWINFSCENTDSCGSVDYGVTIDPGTGEFGGKAWGENIGWTNFSVTEVAVKTSWRGDSDRDGVRDDEDGCPDEDATGLDADGDGCIDSFEGLLDVIDTMVDDSAVSERLQNNLTSKVENASSSATKGNICTAVNKIEAFQNQVKAQRGKKITDEAADILISYADNLTAQLLDQLPEGKTC